MFMRPLSLKVHKKKDMVCVGLGGGGATCEDTHYYIIYSTVISLFLLLLFPLITLQAFFVKVNSFPFFLVLSVRTTYLQLSAKLFPIVKV